MKVSVKTIYESCYKNDSEDFSLFLKFKKELMSLKKEGVVYFNSPISSVEKETIIDFYHILHPGKKELQNAFPMPKYLYRKDESLELLLEKMKKHHSKYYGVPEMDSSYFLKYYNLTPYNGRQAVWFYKK